MVTRIYRSLPAFALAATAMLVTSCEDKDSTLDMPRASVLEEVNLNVSDLLPLAVGCDSAINYTVAPLDALYTGLAWSSSNEMVATVSPEGVITALSVGKAVISVTPEIGFGPANTMKAIEVNVIPELIPTTSITVTNTDTELYEGDRMQLSLSYAPVDHTYSHVFWSTSDPALATVDANGMVTAVGNGKVVITAKTQDTGVTASFTLDVMRSIPAQSVELVAPDAPFAQLQSYQLIANTVPADATRATLAWSCDDESVLTVDDNGVVTTKAAGVANVTVTCRETGESSTVAVNVPAGYYLWDKTNRFNKWTRNGSFGSMTVGDEAMECTVSNDANKRINLQQYYQAGSAAKDGFIFSFVNYPIVAFEADAELEGANPQCNIVNKAGTISASPSMSKFSAANGNIVYYIDFSNFAKECGEDGTAGVRGFIFKILKSPVASFNIYSIGTYPSLDALKAAKE